MITCNVSAIDEIVEILNQAQVDNYQIVDQVLGILPVGDPRMNNPVWPGYSNLILIRIEQDHLARLSKQLDVFNSNLITDEERVFYSSWTID